MGKTMILTTDNPLTLTGKSIAVWEGGGRQVRDGLRVRTLKTMWM